MDEPPVDVTMIFMTDATTRQSLVHALSHHVKLGFIESTNESESGNNEDRVRRDSRRQTILSYRQA